MSDAEDYEDWYGKGGYLETDRMPYSNRNDDDGSNDCKYNGGKNDDYFYRKKTKDITKKKLIVFGLKSNFSDEEVRAAFAEYGEIDSFERLDKLCLTKYL
jgi:hypothetical protein